MLRIDARASRELQAAILGVRRAGRDFQSNIRKYTKAELAPEWQKGLAERASTRLESRALVETARVQVSNQNVKLKSAGLARKLPGGGDARVIWPAIEFGADQGKESTYAATSRKGRRYNVTRRTRSQLRPRNKQGYVIIPTVKALIPRFASLWVQTVVRTFLDGTEGR